MYVILASLLAAVTGFSDNLLFNVVVLVYWVVIILAFGVESYRRNKMYKKCKEKDVEFAEQGT